MAKDMGKPLVSMPGVRPVGSCAKDSGGGNMKRNPSLAKTVVSTSKTAGSSYGKKFGPDVSAPLGNNYDLRTKK